MFKKKLHKIILFIALLVYLPFFQIMEIAADDFKFIPSLAVREKYDDNIFFDDNNKEKDFITTISPELRLDNKTERLKIRLYARCDTNIYSNNHDLDATDQFYKSSLDYQMTPRTALGVDAGYNRNSSIDRDIEVLEGGTATGLIMDNSTRIQENYSFSFNNMLTEKTAAAFSCSFASDDFENRSDNDIRSHTANLNFTRSLDFIDELTTARINFAYGKYKFLDSENVRVLTPSLKLYFFDNSKTESYSVTIGVSRNINEIFSILVDIGGRYTESSYENRNKYVAGSTVLLDDVTKNKNNGTGLVTQAVASYNGELTSYSLNFFHDLRPASGRSGAMNRTSASFNFRRKFNYQLSGGLMMEYYLNKADKGEFSAQGEDERTWRIRPQVRYNFTNNLFAEASYSFTHIKDKEDHTDRQRNVFLFRIKIDYL